MLCGHQRCLVSGRPATNDHDSGHLSSNSTVDRGLRPAFSAIAARRVVHCMQQITSHRLGLPPCRSMPPTGPTCIPSRCCSAAHTRRWRGRAGCTAGD
nr:hypothetical protein JVH1_7917 [Rhodococcus sp. JVH1]